MNKRFISILMSAALVLTAAPVTSYAAQETHETAETTASVTGADCPKTNLKK